MVTVRYSPDKHILKMKGHADFGEVGTDIICAAISTIYYNLCQMFHTYPKEAFKELDMKEATGKNGVTSIKCTPAEGYETWIDHDFLYALRGFEMIQGQYPECLNLIITEH